MNEEDRRVKIKKMCVDISNGKILTDEELKTFASNVEEEIEYMQSMIDGLVTSRQTAFTF